MFVSTKTQQGSRRMTHLKIPSLFLKTLIFVPLFVLSNLVNAALILNGNFDND